MLQMLLTGAIDVGLFALDVAFGAAILYGFYKIADEPDMEFIDYKVACLFVFIPSVLIFALTSLLSTLNFYSNFDLYSTLNFYRNFNFNVTYALSSLVLYALIPFFWLKYFLDFNKQSAALYAIAVPVAIAAKWLVYAATSKMIEAVTG